MRCGLTGPGGAERLSFFAVTRGERKERKRRKKW
jgi:hypothetical protein